MKSLPTSSRVFKSLDVESDVLITVDNICIRVKANGKYIVLSGNFLRALLIVRKNSGMFGAVPKMIESADLILSHVDVNICLYNERFAVIGPKAVPVVNWAKSAIIRFFSPK